MVIKKIVLDLGNKKTLELNMSEAKELFDALGEIFKVKIEKEYIPSRYPWTWPYYGSSTGFLDNNPKYSMAGETLTLKCSNDNI